MSTWTPWRDHPRMVTSPYVNWWLMQHGLGAGPSPMRMTPSLRRMDDFDALQGSLADFTALGHDPSAFMPGGSGADWPVFPVPDSSANPDFLNSIDGAGGWLPENANYPTVGADTLIAGVIDVDIGLGHRRFRQADGSTRVLASWQQGAPWGGGPGHLPFGAQLMESDINSLLAQHSSDGDLTRPLDQDGFNRAAHLVDMARPDGLHALATSEAHGTHVMGLVAGADPVRDAPFSDRVRLLVVNLPPASAYGEGGAFLDYYLVYAMRWIVEMHARISNASGLAATPPPLLLNISFGKQAGAKDERQVFVREARRLSEADQILGQAKFNAILPAGNDNLSRVHARFELQPGDEQALDWRIQPDDDTSNFVEIWVEKLLTTGTVLAPIDIDVVPPGGTAGAFQPAASGQITELTGGLGRVYCDAVEPEDGASVRFRYLICLAPDHFMKGGKVGAAAGKWTIRFRNSGDTAHTVRATIQTDQATLPGQRNARRSYFEAADYMLFEQSGREADTFAYVDGASPAPNLDRSATLRRRGTLNSYAANRYVATIAGHRETDGRPAPYSASGIGHPVHAGGRGAPTVSFPADDGAAHFGLLSDGASDGSVAAMQGTSFSCACATRWLIESWLAGQFDPQAEASDVQAFLRAAPLTLPRPDKWHDAPVGPEKVGAGRASWQPARPVSRLG
ncbi:S8 family serine peptidase [Roseovarius faecimaris]|nr:S8 family serine peptidase [Roseovarius faecimaris]